MRCSHGADDEILARDATQREPRVVLSLSTLPGRIGALESMLGRPREANAPRGRNLRRATVRVDPRRRCAAPSFKRSQTPTRAAS